MSQHLPERIAVPGTFNFRDLGGWQTPHGPVAAGQFFRADGLANLNADSLRIFEGLGIATVIDLRETREARSAPDKLGELPIEHIRLPLFGDRYYPLDTHDAERIVLTEHTLPQVYAAIIETCGSRIADTMRLLANASGPVVYHCSAGKDRTGIISAFVLTLLGVDRDDVLADYQATERFLGPEFLEAIGRNFADAGIVANLSHTATQAPKEYMSDLLTRVDEEFGSVAGYLTDHGLGESEIEALRQAGLSRPA